MIISTYKTSVSNIDDAEKLMHLIDPFFFEANISFNLDHADKLLSIESEVDEYHPEMVIAVLKAYNFECIDISNHSPHIK